MKTRFLEWARKQPLTLSALAAWILDIANSMYFIRYWINKNYSAHLWQLALSIRGESMYELDPTFREELIGITNVTAGSILLGFLMVNSVFYLFFTRHKHWAYQYVLSYSITAAAISLMTLFEGFPVGGAWELINILSIPAYAILAAMVWSRKSSMKERGFRWGISLEERPE